METITKFDNLDDCQNENTILTKSGNKNKKSLITENQIANEEKTTKTTTTTSAKTTKTATIIIKHATSPTPTATNKLKSQQQQHQFRAPQQFVKHKKTSSTTPSTSTSTSSPSSSSSSSPLCAATTTAVANSSLNNNNNNNKKNKCWNKRQHRSSRQNTQTAANNSPNNTTASLETDDTKTTSKADLENIQNLKNPQQFNNHHGGGVGTTTTTTTATGGQGGLPACLSVTSDKLGYGHGHIKQQQQLHKKPLPPHRGGGGGGGGGGGHNNHHHHILCAGSAHNTLGSAGPAAVANAALVAGGVSASNLTCCHINGCSSHAVKDSNSASNSSSTNSSATLHFCCLRSKFFLPDKRPRKGNFIPPTKFLLGGNISDPLNLNSLQNEVSGASSNSNTPATTPRQSPITTPPKVEVIIPPNIHDPLHLLDPVDSMEYEKQLTSPMKRGLSIRASLALGLRAGQTKSHKHRHRKNRKPKRRRYDSFNSTTSTITDSLEEFNNTTSTEKGVSKLSVLMVLENKIKQQETNSAGSGGEDEELSEHNIHSPQEQQQQLSILHNATITTPDITTTTITTTTAIEEVCGNSKITKTLSSTPASSTLQENHEIVESVDMTNTTSGGNINAAADVVLTARERACRDLRLDLISTTTGSGSNNTSCGSSVVSSGGGGANVGGSGSRKRKTSESNNSQKNKKYFRNDSMDKIVSPVVPQPGAWKRPPRTTATGARKSQSRRSTSVSETAVTDLSPKEETSTSLVEEIPRDDTPEFTKVETSAESGLASSPLSTASGAISINTGEPDVVVNAVTNEAVDTKNALTLPENVKKEIMTKTIFSKTPKPKFYDDGKQYRYGNYDRYAGLRHLNEFMDIRLQVFLQYPELFKNKDILDIGCNVGHMTITVARKLAPKSILGIDIDKELIARARRNLSMYVRIPAEMMKKDLMEVDEKETRDAAVAEVKQKKGRRRRRKKKSHVVENIQQQQQHNHHHHHGNYTHWQQFHHHLLHYHLLHHHHNHHHHHHHHLYLQQDTTNNVDTSNFFPISFPLSYGGITGSTTKATSPQNIESQSPASTSTTTRSTPGHPATSTASNKANTSISASTHHKANLLKSKNDFPNNVYFRQTNYVLKDESLFANDTQQYDLILCLSITKWIHLNFGDAGLKSAFKRMFNQLRPGGKLILEAQNWASYKKKKNLTEDIYHNYHNIEFYPNKFHEYLLSSEVGFSHSYTLGIPKHLSKGFSRPIQLYSKGDYTPNHVRWSDAYYPQTPFEAYRGIYATIPSRPSIHSSYPLISSSRSQNYDTPHYTGGGGGASGPYSCRQTPMHQPSTSQSYNPLESDSYQPSYDEECLNHMYVFPSPLYQTAWSPPTSMRKSSSHTPVFGSVRDADEGDGTVMAGGSYHKHVYPPNDDTSSPNANAINAFNSIRDPDTDDSNQQRPHVYATNCGESSTSPHPNLNPNDAEAIEEVLLLDDERCDLSEA